MVRKRNLFVRTECESGRMQGTKQQKSGANMVNFYSVNNV